MTPLAKDLADAAEALASIVCLVAVAFALLRGC